MHLRELYESLNHKELRQRLTKQLEAPLKQSHDAFFARSRHQLTQTDLPVLAKAVRSQFLEAYVLKLWPKKFCFAQYEVFTPKALRYFLWRIRLLSWLRNIAIKNNYHSCFDIGVGYFLFLQKLGVIVLFVLFSWVLRSMPKEISRGFFDRFEGSSEFASNCHSTYIAVLYLHQIHWFVFALWTLTARNLRVGWIDDL